MRRENRTVPGHSLVDERLRILCLVSFDQLQSLAYERKAETSWRKSHPKVTGAAKEEEESGCEGGDEEGEGGEGEGEGHDDDREERIEGVYMEMGEWARWGFLHELGPFIIILFFLVNSSLYSFAFFFIIFL